MKQINTIPILHIILLKWFYIKYKQTGNGEKNQGLDDSWQVELSACHG